jgi:flagellar hook assembly protein FlgD
VEPPAARVTRLHAPHPNPFNPATTVAFELATPGRASLTVYALDGRRVARLVDGDLAAGAHRAVWRGRDDAGRPVASGTYLVQLRAPDRTESQRLTLVK